MQYGEVDLCEVSGVSEGQDVAVAHESDELHKLAGGNLHRCGGSVCRPGCHPHGCWYTGQSLKEPWPCQWKWFVLIISNITMFIMHEIHELWSFLHTHNNHATLILLDWQLSNALCIVHGFFGAYLMDGICIKWYFCGHLCLVNNVYPENSQVRDQLEIKYLCYTSCIKYDMSLELSPPPLYVSTQPSNVSRYPQSAASWGSLSHWRDPTL